MRNLAGTRTVCRIGLLAGVLMCAAGCGKDHDATEKRLRQLQDELTRLQNSSDRLEERLTVLELRPLEASAPHAAAAEVAPETLERPPLQVVRLAPGESKTQPAEAEPPRANPQDPAAAGSSAESEPVPAGDDGTRTLIRGQGSRIETRVSRRKSGGSGWKRADQTAPIQN